MFWDYRSVRQQAQRQRVALGLPAETPTGEREPPQVELLWEGAHTRGAARMLAAINDLQGFWVKVGQYLSSRPDIMPQAYLTELGRLQDSAPPQPWSDVEATLDKELGPSWRNQFEWVDQAPMGTASIGQVHEGRLATGQRVAIKVQHKNVAERMVQDLENLRVLTELLHRFESDADYRTVVGEWATEVIRELDFRTEAANLAEVKANLAATSVTAIVPTAFPEMVTRRVLVMEFCEGVSVRDSARLDAMGVDRRVLMDRICEAFADQIHRHGFFNGDPHPGNLHVSTDPAQNCGDPSVPVLLDFGLTKRFEPDMKVAFARMVYSSSVADVDGLITGFREMGLKFKEDPFEDLRNTQSLFRAVPKSKMREERARASRIRAAKESRREEPRRPVEAWPSELVFFFRVTALLKGLVSEFDLEYPYLHVMAAAAKDTLLASPPPGPALPDHGSATPRREANSGEVSTEVGSPRLHQRLTEVVGHVIAAEEAIGMQ
ncbi:hypothetical protein CYMTET_17746, partial [Cymbomonas tetramitiformis]